MRCISPIKAGYDRLYDITYRKLSHNPEIPAFEFECRRCLACRLNIALEKGTRAWHESQMHENAMFLTLTYSEKHLNSPRLVYNDWQAFIRSLREHATKRIKDKANRALKYIPVMVTGEYGDIDKRPHFHALVYNFWPHDAEKYYKNDGNQFYKSEFIENLWGKGDPDLDKFSTDFSLIEYGNASYVARYAAKKLVHGHDQDHDFHPIHKTSSRHAIGKTWIEKYWEQTFNHGYVLLPKGDKRKIPRYYRDWCKQNQPKMYLHYVTQVQPKMIELAQEIANKEFEQFLFSIKDYKGGAKYPLTRSKVKETILQAKFKQQMERKLLSESR